MEMDGFYFIQATARKITIRRERQKEKLKVLGKRRGR
jgi:hypothetical protein